MPTGCVTREPDFADHHRIRRHIPPVELEVSIHKDWDEGVVDDLAGLPIVTAHAVKAIGATLSGDDPAFDRFALDCRIASALGARLLVLHLWELPDGDRYLDRNLAHLPALLDLAEEHGLALTVETVPCTAGTPVENVVRACERDDRCRVTLDTEFLGLHGQLDAALEIAELVAHVHAKDFRPDVWGTKPRRYFLPGEGVLDIFGFLERLRHDGTVTLEFSAVRDDGTVDAVRLEEGLAWLHRLAE
ncbi:MAG TPA: TIM barrel protein [Gaiellaceae bacterium]|nr:TIM barrel protein [Gaiellaceae bacterium]